MSLTKDSKMKRETLENASEKKERGATLKPVPASIRIDLFGDLLKFSKKSQQPVSFRKFDQFALFLANKSREERILMYKIFCGLSLTAHARRTKNEAERKNIFELKNQLFVSIANDPATRRIINLRIGVSKRFKVVEYCGDCTKKNTEENLQARSWQFCQKCRIDRNYYNILSLFHKFEDGYGSIFLGYEHLEKVQFFREIKKMPLAHIQEEISFSKYKFNPKTLISIEIESLSRCSQKLIELSQKTSGIAQVSNRLQNTHHRG
jgi:hypothetical protein